MVRTDGGVSKQAVSEVNTGELVRVFGTSNAVPYTLHALVTTECSLGCPGCFYRDVEGRWDWPFAERIVNEAADMGIQWLAIGGGEPTEWPYLKSMINLALKLGLKVAVTTNGVKLEPVLQTVDRVQVSHDHIHTEGSQLSEDEREAQVLKAIKYYKFAFCPVGINSILGDRLLIGDKLLNEVTNVTLVLPKPIALKDGMLERYQRVIDYYDERVPTCIDSCAACVGGAQCYQGRTSMAIDQRGMASVCSNVEVKYCASTLREMWEGVRCKTDQAPKECLLEEL
jgi:organic radical activating enzyme